MPATKRLGAQFWGGAESRSEAFSIKEVRRKPLAFAADEWSYGI
jgi:hypothetical protein